MNQNDEREYFFDKPRNIQRVLWALYAICAVLLALDVILHRKVYHAWEWLWGFYPLYGFVGCVILVLVAKWMRTFLMRSEDYYQRDDGASADSGAKDGAE